MNITRCSSRDNKLSKRKNKHKVSGKSVFTLEEIMQRKAERAKRKLEKRLQKDAEEIENDT